MRAIAPKLQALKDKHGDDRMAMSQEMMQLYRDEKSIQWRVVCRF